MRFYATYFEFDPATAQPYQDGTVIVRNADRFDVALHPATEAAASSTFAHFGLVWIPADAEDYIGPDYRLTVYPDRTVHHLRK